MRSRWAPPASSAWASNASSSGCCNRRSAPPPGPLMPQFPPHPTPGPAPTPLTPETVRSVIADAVRPAHFFVGGRFDLDADPPGPETVAWEVFHGRLLDPAFTRLRRSFETWNLFLVEGGVRSAEPVL